MIRPDFSSVYSKANEILISSSIISSFPFSAIDLVEEQADIKCIPYSKALNYGLDIMSFGSESAVIFEFKGRFIIFYNDNKPLSHIQFSILHELGHYINKHSFLCTDNSTYSKYEVETNFFTAQLLMPEQIIREVQRRGQRITRAFLIKHFGVSAQAADKRIATLDKTSNEWRTQSEQEFDDIIFLKYQDFINTICPAQHIFDFEEEYRNQLKRDQWN